MSQGSRAEISELTGSAGTLAVLAAPAYRGRNGGFVGCHREVENADPLYTNRYMRIEKTRLTCKCGQVFDAEIVVDAPVGVHLASMQAVRCPGCGAGGNKLFFGGELGGKPAITALIEYRMAWWRDRGDKGISSETIYSAYVGTAPGRVDVPHDPDDFSRCKKLLDLIPEWRANLATVSKRYPWFAPMVDAWPALESLYADGVKRNWKPPNLMYEAMRPIVEQCCELRQQRGA